jgi:hypothetical protein
VNEATNEAYFTANLPGEIANHQRKSGRPCTKSSKQDKMTGDPGGMKKPEQLLHIPVL